MTITRTGVLRVALLTLALVGCEGRDKATPITTGASSGGSSTSVTIGGTLSGLASGESVVLELNGADPQTVSAGGKFSFSAIALGTSYDVTVATAPAGQTCTVTGGQGTATSASAAAIEVSCVDQTYTVGGSVTGLTTSGLVLANGTDRLTVAANASSFTMHASVAYSSRYAVTVQTQPASATCTVANGSNTMGAKPVTNIAVTCAPATYTVGGSISGLGNVRGLVLANGSDTLSVPPNATTFTMPRRVVSGSNYNIMVQTHPPLQLCSVTNGAGPVAGANITNVMITCAPGTESVLYSFTTTGGDANLPYRNHMLLASDGNFYGLTYSGGAHGYGAVFKITPAGVETVLYSFASLAGGNDAADPYGGLVQGTDGNFYGLTSYGGANSAGTAFKITPAGVETVLHSFAAGSDGSAPYGSLVQGTDGNFYGTTRTGGPNGEGTVFKITPAGVETVLWSFGSAGDGDEPYYESLVQGTDGNFYGTTRRGGTNDDGTVFMITPAGVETVLWSFGGGSDGEKPYGGLVQGTDGNFYGMTYQGGANNEGTIFEITPSGTETVMWTFGAGSDGDEPGGDLTVGPDGTLYGLTYQGGANGAGAVIQFN